MQETGDGTALRVDAASFLQTAPAHWASLRVIQRWWPREVVAVDLKDRAAAVSRSDRECAGEQIRTVDRLRHVQSSRLCPVRHGSGSRPTGSVATKLRSSTTGTRHLPPCAGGRRRTPRMSGTSGRPRRQSACQQRGASEGSVSTRTVYQGNEQTPTSRRHARSGQASHAPGRALPAGFAVSVALWAGLESASGVVRGPGCSEPRRVKPKARRISPGRLGSSPGPLPKPGRIAPKSAASERRDDDRDRR